ncbi:hypothetical protein JFV29_16165 [Peribacillus sp. TH16]|nr:MULTISPECIES: hypothetical protein [unclassified Peribacillus]MBK5441960.1 hypothetical protein [Peribacillus sp. TH24]MBK5463264.1 hypothetical protein [Peribacillus sp. TH27]MBK5483382.1 hypothetical protein [Peribacillus sp. TH16]
MDIGHLKHGLVIKATKLRTWILWGSVTDINSAIIISLIIQFLYLIS